MTGTRMPQTDTTDLIACDRGKADLILNCALNIARRIIECGGEVRRAEETVEFICHSYGIGEMEVFAIISEIQATIRTPDGRFITQIVRVHNWQNDMRQLDAYNSLSRRICVEKPEPELLEDMLHATRADDRKHPVLTMLCYFLGAFAFCLFFDGSLLDALTAGAVGLAIYLLDRIKPMWMNSIAHAVIAASVAGIFSQILVHIGIGDSAAHVMMGTVMLLTPGLALGNAIRDLLCGDLIAGALRLMQVLLSAISIAAGLVVTVWFGGILF